MGRIGHSLLAMLLALGAVTAIAAAMSLSASFHELHTIGLWALPFVPIAWATILLPTLLIFPPQAVLWRWFLLLPAGAVIGTAYTFVAMRIALWGSPVDPLFLIFGTAVGLLSAAFFLALEQRGARTPKPPVTSLLLLGLAAATAGCASETEVVATPPPNIILFFSDDAGYVDFGFQGAEDYQTPHLDRLAAEGVRFEQAYVSASVCSPSRAGLLTGRYQQRFGHEYNLPGMADKSVPASARGLPLSETTMAELLRDQGYATGIVGKWHLGTEPQFHPMERGFDEFFGMVGGGSAYQAGKAKAILRGHEPVPAEELPYLTDAFGAEAVSFVERHAEEPFFLFLSFNAPHTPMQARADLLEEMRPDFETAARAKNAAMTHSLDSAVGAVLAKLDELNLADNTLVVFANDNGGAMPYNASFNGRLRGTKGTVLEGGVRVPMLIRWPRVLEAGSEFPHPVSTLDLLPTFLAAAGATPPADIALDGRNLLPALADPSPAEVHSTLYWKLNWGAAVRRGDWKLVRTPADEIWLFNLATDPGESTDLAASEPVLVEELQTALLAWEADLPPPLWVSAPMWRRHSLERYALDFGPQNTKR